MRTIKLEENSVMTVTQSYEEEMSKLSSSIEIELKTLADDVNNVSSETGGWAYEVDLKEPHGQNVYGTMWRTMWIKILETINDSIYKVWITNGWRKKIEQLSQNQVVVYEEKLVDGGVTPEDANWMKNEDAFINFGGSLVKGYKGPPKQFIQFSEKSFDVDANMKCDGLSAIEMINGETIVDRGTIKPKQYEGAFDNLDTAMNNEVVVGLNENIGGLIIGDVGGNGNYSKDTRLSEKFETLLVPTDRLNGVGEIKRSNQEQLLRDKYTRLVKDHVMGVGTKLHYNMDKNAIFNDVPVRDLVEGDLNNGYSLKKGILNGEQLKGLDLLIHVLITGD